MRVLFWLLLAMFTFFGVLTLALYNTEEAGMAMILFLPFCAIHIVSGLGAGAMSKFKPSNLKATEIRVGIGAGVFALISLTGLAAVLTLE